MAAFDFAAFRDAFEARDAERWLEFYAADAEWFEFRGHNPPRAPHVMRGRTAIAAHLRAIAAADLTIAISNEVPGTERAAFTATIELAGGRRIIENVILELDAGRIARQTDVEAWD